MFLALVPPSIFQAHSAAALNPSNLSNLCTCSHVSFSDSESPTSLL